MSQTTNSSASATSIRARRRRRRRYTPPPDAKPEISIEQLPGEQQADAWRWIHHYRNDAHHERIHQLSAERIAKLDWIERRAAAEGWPADLLNANRPSFARDADGKLAGPLVFGYDVGGDTDATIMPALAKRARRCTPPAPAVQPAQAMDDLERRLLRSLELASER